MAHEVEGRIMSASGINAWHGLANTIPGQATLLQAIELGGLDWQVSVHPSSVIGDGFVTATNEFMNIVRSTDHKILGQCKGRYTAVQNLRLFEMLEEIIHASEGAAVWETAGSLRGGQVVFGSIRLGAWDAVKEDPHHDFLSVFGSHDGSGKVRFVAGTVRVVCANTMRVSLREAADQFAVKHTKRFEEKMRSAAEFLKINLNETKFLEMAIKSFVSKPLTNEITSYVLDRAIPLPRVVIPEGKGLLDAVIDMTTEEVAGRAMTIAVNKRERVKELITCGIGQDIQGVEGTCYSLWNAFTEYADHESTVRPHKGRSEADSRVDSLLFGSAAELKERAYVALQAVC